MNLDGLFGLSADNWVAVIIAAVAGFFTLSGWVITKAASLVKWLLDNSQQNQRAANDERVSTLKDVHAERVSTLREQVDYYRNRLSESLGANYESSKENLELAVRDKEALDRVLHTLQERQGAARQQLEAQIQSKDKEITQLRERYGAVTSTVITVAEPEVYRFIGERLANLDIGAALEDPTRLKNYIIYWAEGDNHYFWDVVDHLAKLTDEEIQVLHRATLIPMRLLERLKGMAGLPQKVDGASEREHEEIRKDLILSVFLSMPRKRSVVAQPATGHAFVSKEDYAKLHSAIQQRTADHRHE